MNPIIYPLQHHIFMLKSKIILFLFLRFIKFGTLKSLKNYCYEKDT